MAEVKAFKGVYYNKEKISDFKDVVAPPYDIISEEQQSALLNSSPYNFTHIDFNKDKPGDDKDQNKYTRAAATFESWLKKGVMVEDEKPSIYFYKQEYTMMGQKYNRLGIIALLELERNETKVHPHENTHAKAVEDRLRLTKALNANLSCIFVCYSDRQKKVEKIFNKNVVQGKPLVDVIGPDKVRHKIWRFDDEELIKEITSSVSGQNLFIADGHHRFKVAKEYQDFRISKKGSVNGNEPFNYVMTYFTNMDSRDLQILPMHRIVKRMPKGREFLEEFFRIDKVKKKEDLLVLLAKAGKNEHAFGLYTRDGIWLLRLKNNSLINELIHEGSREYKNLDATILKYFVFDKLGILSEDIMYTSSFSDVMEKVDLGQAEAGFVMNPVRIQQLQSIALNGERMPPKTTYFFPKVLSGLTVYKME